MIIIEKLIDIYQFIHLKFEILIKNLIFIKNLIIKMIKFGGLKEEIITQYAYY